MINGDLLATLDRQSQTQRSTNTSPGWSRKPVRKPLDGLVKKTEITLSTLEKAKKPKPETSLADARGRSPHGQMYLLDKNFRSYNSISQRRTQGQSSTLLDRLRQSCLRGDRPKAPAAPVEDLPRSRPPEPPKAQTAVGSSTQQTCPQ